MNPRAWLVVTASEFEAVFLDRAAAERYAVACHGIVMPLYAEVSGSVIPFTPPRSAP